LRVRSPATHASNFSTPDCKKNQLGTLSQEYCNRRNSYRGAGQASTPPDSILHKIIIIISWQIKNKAARATLWFAQKISKNKECMKAPDFAKYIFWAIH